MSRLAGMCRHLLASVPSRKNAALMEAPIIEVMTIGLIRECAHCGYWQDAAWNSPFEQTEHDCVRDGVTHSITWKRAS